MASARTSFNNQPIPADGQRIEFRDGKYVVPDRPIIPFVEGDGTGRDIWKASRRVFDAAVEKAYGGKRVVAWYEIYAGEKAFEMFKEWMPQDTIRPSGWILTSTPISSAGPVKPVITAPESPNVSSA